MADCSNIYAPSEEGGSLTCVQFDASMLELQILCDEVNAIQGSVREVFDGLTAGDRVTLSMMPASIKEVHRNGLAVEETLDWELSVNQIVFLDGVPFGPSTNGLGEERITVVYAPV